MSLLGLVQSEASKPRFTAVVTNPPYQRNNDTKTTATAQIYPLFVERLVKVARYSGFLIPARWFNNHRQEGFREFLHSSGVGENSRYLTHYPDESVLFGPDICIRNGVTVWFLDSQHSGFTEFYRENQLRGVRPLLSPSNTVEIDSTIIEIREKIQQFSYTPMNKATRNYNFWVREEIKPIYGGCGYKQFFENSLESPTFPFTVPTRLNGNVWRYMDSNVVNYRVAPNRWSLAFSILSQGPNDDISLVGAWNKPMVFSEGETTMSMTGWEFDSLLELTRFYKFTRTKFFTRLVIARINSHNASPYAYQDVPIMEFSDTTVIDWDGTVSEIDTALLEYFGLVEYAEWFAAAKFPYAGNLDVRSKELLSEHGFAVEELERL